MLGAIIGHLFGDYIIQNDWMALNKKKDSFTCAIHCFLWAWSVMLFGLPWSSPSSVWSPVCLVLFATHYLQDRTAIIVWWMKFNGQEKFMTGSCSPWSIIVVDNVWHIVTIFIVWKLFRLE